jgi:hypothetical protein
MAAVQLDAGQKAVLDAIDAALDNLFTNGAEQPAATVVYTPLAGYQNLSNVNGKDSRPDVRKGFEIMLAALSVGAQAWITPSLGSGWSFYGAPYNTPGYYKDVLGIVHLRGLLASSGATSLIFTLPAGYRPIAQCLFPSFANSAAARVDVQTDGQVLFQYPGGATPWVTLDGITFRTA